MSGENQISIPIAEAIGRRRRVNNAFCAQTFQEFASTVDSQHVPSDDRAFLPRDIRVLEPDVSLVGRLMIAFEIAVFSKHGLFSRD